MKTISHFSLSTKVWFHLTNRLSVNTITLGNPEAEGSGKGRWKCPARRENLCKRSVTCVDMHRSPSSPISFPWDQPTQEFSESFAPRWGGRQMHTLQCRELNTGGSHPPSTCKLGRIWKQGFHGCNKHKGIVVLSRSVRNVDTTTVEDSCAKAKAGSVMACAQTQGQRCLVTFNRGKRASHRLQGRLPTPWIWTTHPQNYEKYKSILLFPANLFSLGSLALGNSTYRP